MDAAIRRAEMREWDPDMPCSSAEAARRLGGPEGLQGAERWRSERERRAAVRRLEGRRVWSF